MRISRAVLWLIARVVPAQVRGRWLEEWRAELRHGRRTMIAGALADLDPAPPSRQPIGEA